MRLGAVQAALGVSEPRHFDKWRKRLGKQWEHVEATGPHRGVWVFAPGWLLSWKAFDGGAGGSSGTAAAVDALSGKKRVDAIKLRNLELDLEERELKHAERKQEVVRVDELNEIFVSVLGGIGRVAERLPNAQKLMISEEMKDGLEAYTARFNGHSDHRITDLGRAESVRPGDLDRDAADAADAPRVRAKVRRHAPRRPKGGAEVS
jgi:hypothetical protein